MKALSPATLAHLGGEATTFDVLWKVTRKDVVIMGFTSGTRDLTYGGVQYAAGTGILPSNVQAGTGKGVDNLTVQGLIPSSAMGMLSSVDITDADLLNGVYDDAEVEIFLLNRDDLTQDPIVLVSGYMGECSLSRGAFETEVRSLLQRAAQIVGSACSATCRAIVGDVACGVNLASYTFSGAVSGSTNASQFSTVDAAITAKGAYYFAYGRVQWTSGDNTGREVEVRNHNTGSPMLFTLIEPMSYPIQAGDTFDIIAGCDNTLATCKAKFNNVVRFRGEPYIPGTDAALRIIRA